MLFGGPVRLREDIPFLRSLLFDFGEITLSSAKSRRTWWESGMRGDVAGFSLVAHGPAVMDDPDDTRYLWSHYVPELLAAVDTAQRMGIALLTIHLSADRRFLNPWAIGERTRALRELVTYGMKHGVVICLENVTESVHDLQEVFAAVPDLRLTLDVGHAWLGNDPDNCMAILKELRPFLRHIHLHDNHGGTGQVDDRHLAIGDGSIDFREPLAKLLSSGYDAGITLEVKREDLEISRTRLICLLDEIRCNAE